jgi:gas vesicle protein
MRNFGMYVLGAAIGGLLGAGIGLLLAPKAGDETRSDINGYVVHVREEVVNASQQRRVELQKELDRMREPEIPVK